LHIRATWQIETSRLDEQELAALALHLLQISLVYVNTLMIQRMLHGPNWQGGQALVDLQRLTPLVLWPVPALAFPGRSRGVMVTVTAADDTEPAE
jgi:hypothetical protein